MLVRPLAASLLAALSTAHTQGSPFPVAITHVNVVDVERGHIVADQTVVITGNRISAVSRTGSARIPRGARTFDGTGKYLIPGLWDMHVHAVVPGLGEYFLPLLLANGVTGVRDMFTTTAAVAGFRSRIASGEMAGPRVGTFGALVDGDPPVWPGSVVARTPEDGRRIVDSLRNAGVGFVKVYSRLLPETFGAIAERARALGMPVAGHVPALVSASAAARAGQRTVEHLSQVMHGCSSREEELIGQMIAAVLSDRGGPKGWDSAGVVSRGQAGPLVDSFDKARCARLALDFKAAGTWMVPTLAVIHSVTFFDDSTLAQDSRLKYIPAFLKNAWNPKTDAGSKKSPPEDLALRNKVYARHLEIVGLFHRNGVKFLAGTDLANPHLYPGFSLHDELGLLVSVGFTPLEALQAATIDPARFLGATDSLGTVAPGKLADLVLLGANPLTDIANVRKIEVVIADGRVYDGEARTRLFTDAERRAGGTR